MQVIPNGLIGFRIFKIYNNQDENKFFGPKPINLKDDLPTKNLRLGGLFMRSLWQSGLNRAECKSKRKGFYPGQTSYCSSVPEENCQCGLQGYYQLGDKVILSPSFFEEHVLAAIIAGGEVRLHPDGFRAEKAALVGLLMNEYNLSKETILKHQAIAKNYNVDLFNQRNDLISHASKKGILIKEPKDIKGLHLSQLENKYIGSNLLENSGATNEAYGLGRISGIALLNELVNKKPYPSGKIFFLGFDSNIEKHAQANKMINEITLEIKTRLTGFKKILFYLSIKNPFILIFLITFLSFLGLIAVDLLLELINIQIPGLILVFVFAMLLPFLVFFVINRVERFLKKSLLGPIFKKFAT